MQTATTITDPLVESFGKVRAEITIAISHAERYGFPIGDLLRRQTQVQDAWNTFMDEKHY